MLRIAIISLCALLAATPALSIEFQVPKKMVCNPDGLWNINHVMEYEKTEIDENLRKVFDLISSDIYTETATGVSWDIPTSKWKVRFLSNGNNAMHMKGPESSVEMASTPGMTVWINGESAGAYNTVSQNGSGVIITRGTCEIEW